ncbi:hypothetical protein ACHAPA_007663 [Fusarium lateritium]
MAPIRLLASHQFAAMHSPRRNTPLARARRDLQSTTRAIDVAQDRLADLNEQRDRVIALIEDRNLEPVYRTSLCVDLLPDLNKKIEKLVVDIAKHVEAQSAARARVEELEDQEE